MTHWPLSQTSSARHELVPLLHRAGVGPFERLGDFDGAPVDDTQRELIVVARKPLEGGQVTGRG